MAAAATVSGVVQMLTACPLLFKDSKNTVGTDRQVSSASGCCVPAFYVCPVNRLTPTVGPRFSRAMQVSIGTLPALEVQHISTAQQEQQVKAACNHTRVCACCCCGGCYCASPACFAADCLQLAHSHRQEVCGHRWCGLEGHTGNTAAGNAQHPACGGCCCIGQHSKCCWCLHYHHKGCLQQNKQCEHEGLVDWGAQHGSMMQSLGIHTLEASRFPSASPKHALWP